jgi:AcrR family transcriptional regulator
MTTSAKPQDGRKGRRREAGASGEDRGAAERILDSAEGVLRTHGYAGFSLRRVSEAAGVALGNLTYHYPTKVELVRALIRRLITHYSDRFQEMLDAPEIGLEGLVRWLLEAAVVEENFSLFRELWAMALRDAVVREAVDDFYDQLMAGVHSAILAAYPQADPKGLRTLVHLIATISEGSSVIYGTRRARAAAYADVVDLATRLVRAAGPQLDGEVA